MDLFSNENKDKDLHLPDSEIFYEPNYLKKPEADKLFMVLLESLQWEQHNIKIFGKILPQPRLTALYAENNTPYSYSNLTLQPHAFTQELQDLQELLQKTTGEHFTHCLANLYRNGTDSMGWHSDDEKELGKDPVIASLSFGARRKFQLKHKNRKDLKSEIELEHGSLLLMKGTTQHFWKHQLPKTKKEIDQRINLTFRKIL